MVVDLLQRLRKETYIVINCLKQWREKLQDQSLSFIHKELNYIAKMKNDYNKIIKSSLANWLTLDKDKIDILFLSPKIIDSNRKYFK